MYQKGVQEEICNSKRVCVYVRRVYAGCDSHKGVYNKRV